MWQEDRRSPHGVPSGVSLLRRLQVEALIRRFDLLHLARRFFQVLFPEPLTPAEQAVVAQYLRPREADLFWAQIPADQRHAYETMRRAALATQDAAVLRAALLHDVGKASTTLGAVGRSIATVLDAAHLPLTRTMRLYRAHGGLGAERLEEVGADDLAVAFARRHPDPDPQAHDPAAWAILLGADNV